MNAKSRAAEIETNWKKYHVSSMPNYAHPKKNVIQLFRNNTKAHEMMKSEVCWDLLQDNKTFVTEAVETATNLRRDVVELDTGLIYEIETDPARAKRFIKSEKEGDVIIIPVGWKKTDPLWQKYLKQYDEDLK